MSSFGLREPVGGSKLDALKDTLGTVRPAIAELHTRKAYYEDYGIYTLHEMEDPLTLVKWHPKLDHIEGGPKRTWMRNYHIHNVKDAFGISYKEFKELPYSEARFMMEIAKSSRPMESINKLLKDDLK